MIKKQQKSVEYLFAAITFSSTERASTQWLYLIVDVTMLEIVLLLSENDISDTMSNTRLLIKFFVTLKKRVKGTTESCSISNFKESKGDNCDENEEK